MTIPPARAPGDTGHVGDHNNVSDVLTAHDASISSNTSTLTTHTTGSDPHADRAFTTTAIATHTAATDPHADRAFTTTSITNHSAATDPHGDRANALSQYVKLLDVPDRSALYPPASRLPKWVQPSTIITEFQTSHGWTSAGTGTFNLNDTTAGNFISGSQAASLVTGGAGVQALIRKYSGSIPDTTGKSIRLRLKVDDLTHVNELAFFLGIGGMASYYRWSFTVQGGSAWLTSGDWCTVTLSFADAAITGTPARSGLTDAQLQVYDDSTATVSVHIQSVELISDGGNLFPNGVVSICFDDSYSSARDLGWPRLDLYGFPATLMTISNVLGTTGFHSLADIKTRVDRFGWESAAHAWTDTDHAASYTGLSAAALDTDMRAQRAWLLSNGIRSSDGTAYPLGQFGKTTDAQSTMDLTRKYFSWARTTNSRTTETWPPADPFRLRAVSGISSFSGGISAATVTGKITATKNSRGWLILVFHKIVASSPAATSDILQSDFNTIIDALNTAGIPVMTISGVLSQIGVEPSSVAGTAIPLQLGVASAGTAVNVSHEDHAHPRYSYQPGGHGLLGWSFEPTQVQGKTSLATSGTLNVNRIHLPVAATVTNVLLTLGTLGATLTSGQSFVGIYDSTGALKATSADQTASWNTGGSTGNKTIPLTAPIALAAGDYYIVITSAGTTMPQFVSGGGFSTVNIGMSASTARFGTAATGVTTALPGSMGTVSSNSNAFWVGLS